MPDHEGRAENRIDFTPEGEAANYISLDQVLMLAFQHARNNREIYGKLANVELVWAAPMKPVTSTMFGYPTAPPMTFEDVRVSSNSSYPRWAGLSFGK